MTRRTGFRPVALTYHMLAEWDQKPGRAGCPQPAAIWHECVDGWQPRRARSDAPHHRSGTSRSALALGRIPQADDAIRHCELCAHRCGVDRTQGPTGLCKVGASTHVFSAQIEVTDEAELIPTFAIAFSGCDMRCDFCITGASSWNPRAGIEISPAKLAAQARHALLEGARSVMLLGGEPTIHLPFVLRFVAEMRGGNCPELDSCCEPLNPVGTRSSASLCDDTGRLGSRPYQSVHGEAKLVWKTNGHATPETRALLDGLFDVWVVDYKFGNDGCAQRLSRTPDYTRVVRQNLLWASRNSDLIVRHLLMPGHVECCWLSVAAWLGENLPLTKVNLRTGFWPAWKTSRHPELSGTATGCEALRAREIARQFSLNLVD